MRILLLGGTGFIGSNLQEALKEEHELMLFHRGNKETHTAFESIVGDRKDLRNYRTRFAKMQPDLVIDLISYFSEDALSLVDTFKQITNKVLLISSGDVYRSYEIFKDKEKAIMAKAFTEEDALRTRLYPYRGIDPKDYLLEHYDKIVVENIVRGQSEFDWTILRLGALFGEYDTQRKLKDYIQPMLKGEKRIRIDSKKVNWRWTRAYIKNVVHGIRLVMANEVESKNEIFNIGNRKAYKEIELLHQLQAMTNWKGAIEIVDGLEKETYNYEQDLILNTDKIRQKLGYSEIINFEEGLRSTIQYEEGLIQ